MSAPDDDLGRGKLTLSKRIELLERDRAQQSRVLTELVQAVSKGFTTEQVAQIKTAFREELANAGLRLDDDDHQDEAREDFRFLRRLRQAWDGAAGKVGNAALLAVIGVCATIIGLGFWAWINSGGKPGP